MMSFRVEDEPVDGASDQQIGARFSHLLEPGEAWALPFPTEKPRTRKRASSPVPPSMPAQSRRPIVVASAEGRSYAQAEREKRTVPAPADQAPGALTFAEADRHLLGAPIKDAAGTTEDDEPRSVEADARQPIVGYDQSPHPSAPSTPAPSAPASPAASGTVTARRGRRVSFYLYTAMPEKGGVLWVVGYIEGRRPLTLSDFVIQFVYLPSRGDFTYDPNNVKYEVDASTVHSWIAQRASDKRPVTQYKVLFQIPTSIPTLETYGLVIKHRRQPDLLFFLGGVCIVSNTKQRHHLWKNLDARFEGTKHRRLTHNLRTQTRRNYLNKKGGNQGSRKRPEFFEDEYAKAITFGHLTEPAG